MSKAKSYDVHTIGRRKTSVARVYVSRGTGKSLSMHVTFLTTFLKRQADTSYSNR